MKLNKTSKISLATLLIGAVLVMSMLAIVNASPAVANTEIVKERTKVDVTPLPPKPRTGIVDTTLPTTLPAEVQSLKDQIPASFDSTEAKILPLRGRFLMYTKDLSHIMWGRFGNQYFTGIDNLGKRAWGIYGRGYFAGFYDGQFFWGKYAGGYWAANGLFGLNTARGVYVVYPLIPVATSATVKGST